MNTLDSNGIVWQLGNPQFRNASRACGQVVCLERFVRFVLTIWKFLDFSIIRSLFEAIFSHDVAKEGR